MIQHLVLLFIVCWLGESIAYQKTKIGDLEIDLGANAGLEESSKVSHDTLQKIIAGVENGNKENIYFFGLLKLYGISMTKNTTVAAQHFQRASELGHMEATTAYGVCLATGTGVQLDNVNAVSYLRKGVEFGDAV
jgi:TPR repeat protein